MSYMGRMRAYAAVAAVLSACSPDPGEAPRPAPTTESGRLSDRVELARAHLQEGQFTQTIDVCQAGLAVDSTSAELLNLLATAYAEDGRYALAIEALERIVDLGSSSVLTYVNLGGINTKLGNYPEAEKYLLHAAALAPAHPEMRRRLAEVYLATNRYTEAAGQLEHALRLFPRDATLYYYLGRALEGAGDERAALEAYQEAMELDIGFTRLCYRAAAVARKLKEASIAQEAMRRYQHLQQIGGGDPEPPKQLRKLRDSILEAPEEAIHHFRMGQFFAQHGYYDEALNKFDKVGRMAPDDADMLNRVAGVLVEHKRADAGLGCYLKALAANPDHFPALINAGSLLSLQERHDEALIHLTRAVEVEPGDARGWYCLGLGQLKAGQSDAARQSLQAGLDLDPPDPLRGRLSQLLASPSPR